MNSTPEKALHDWLSKMGIRVSKTLINKQLKGHPDYPSLASISDLLHHLGIENAAFHIEKDQLHEISTPFLAHLKEGSGRFVVVENRDRLENSFPGFFKTWSGAVVVAEKPLTWDHKENNELLQKERVSRLKKATGTCLVILFILAAFSFTSPGILPTLLIIALAGIFISALIISKDLGIENRIADQVCGKESHCSDVIHAKGSELPLGIHWSDIGFTWFVSLFISLLFSVYAGNLAQLLHIYSVLAAAAVPFIAFSVYFQWKVVKKWCRLCLIILGLLLIQAVILFPVLMHISWKLVSPASTVFIAATILITGGTWLFTRSLLQENKSLEKENYEGARFRKNEAVFMALLEKQKSVDVTQWENDLQLGSATAPLQLMVACNPYCRPCAKTHQKLADVPERYRGNIGLTVRFNVERKDVRGMRATRHILQHIEQHTWQMNIAEKAKYSAAVLHQWYYSMDYEQFVARYPVNNNIDVDGLLKQHERWFIESRIDFTPTIFINGRELPGAYGVDELVLMLNSLIDLFLQQQRTEETQPMLA